MVELFEEFKPLRCCLARLVNTIELDTMTRRRDVQIPTAKVVLRSAKGLKDIVTYFQAERT